MNTGVILLFASVAVIMYWLHKKLNEKSEKKDDEITFTITVTTDNDEWEEKSKEKIRRAESNYYKSLSGRRSSGNSRKRPYENDIEKSKQFLEEEGIEFPIYFEKLPLTLVYRGSNGKQSNRAILVKNFDGYYIHAFCKLRNANRTFAIDRIEEAFDENGESIENLVLFLAKKYKTSVSYSLDKFYGKYYDLLRVLKFVVKSDGRYTKKEKAIIRETLFPLIGDDRVTDKEIDGLMELVPTPTMHAYKVHVGKIAKNDPGVDVIDIAKRLISTDKTVTGNEPFAVEYLEKRFEKERGK